MRENPVKRTLAAGGLSLGTMVFGFASANVTRAAAAAGAEFVVLDQEHTAFGIDTIRELLASARSLPLMPFVRVPDIAYDLIARVLDAGAMGIMGPRVDTIEQAELLVASVRYPPGGRRGFGLMHPEEWEPGGVVDTMRKVESETFVMAQVETVGGVEAADAMAALDGIDCLWIGHNDLSNSLGIPGELSHPDFVAAVATVRAACDRHGKALGIMATSLDDARAKMADGFRAIAYSGDLQIYRDALRTALTALRSTS